MEPRLGRRGNKQEYRDVEVREMLQWSPGLVAGETGTKRGILIAAFSLQWSPGLVAGETVLDVNEPQS